MENDKKNPMTCPYDKTINLFSNKWKILIIETLLSDKKRFNELKRLLYGISSKVLTENLRRLEEEGFVKRDVVLDVPIKVEYALTDYGRSLSPVIKALDQWRKTYHCEGDTRAYPVA